MAHTAAGADMVGEAEVDVHQAEVLSLCWRFLRNRMDELEPLHTTRSLVQCPSEQGIKQGAVEEKDECPSLRASGD